MTPREGFAQPPRAYGIGGGLGTEACGSWPRCVEQSLHLRSPLKFIQCGSHGKTWQRAAQVCDFLDPEYFAIRYRNIPAKTCCHSDRMRCSATKKMRHIGLLCLLVAALSFAPNVAAQQRPKDGCALGANIPYPTPVVNIAGVSVSAAEYLNNMACSFIVKLNSSNSLAFDSILTFSQFQTEQNYDFVEVYNGCDPSRSRSGNTSIPPCSLVSDFPFQLFRKSGLFRFAFFGSANKSWRTSLQHQSCFAGFLPSAATYPSPSPPPHPWCWFSFVPTYPSYPKDSVHHWLSRARGRMDLSPSYQILT
jgi:hypothetical protein